MMIFNSKSIICLLSITFVLFTSCSLLQRPAHNKIVYHVFDSLENYLGTQILAGKKMAIYIDPQCTYCRNFDKLKAPAYCMYGMAVEAYDTTYLKHGSENYIALNSNRYLEVSGKLYPVIIFNVDDVFSSAVDSQNLYYRSIYKPQLRDDFYNWFVVDFCKGVYYTDYSDTPHGHVDYLKYPLR